MTTDATPRIYRASELGGCLKAQIAKQLDYEPSEPPETFETLFGEGDLHEQAVIEKLEADGYQIKDRQKEVNLGFEGCLLQGHLDGNILPPDHLRWKVLEIKSMSQNAWDAFVETRWDTPGLIQKYKWQLSTYMHAEDSEALVVIKNRNTGQIRFEGVEIPFYSIHEIADRIAAAEHWVAENQLPTQCDVINYPCPFFYLHVENEVETVEDEELVNEIAKDFLIAKARAERADKELKRRRAELLVAIHEKSKIKTDEYAITYYDYTIKTHDWKQAEKDGVDVKKYEKVTTSKRLRVKDLLQKDDDAD